MASWGLAYEYGKNAYEDMWRKQEENDRYAAQRKLFDMQLKEEEQEMATKSLENARIRQYRDIAVTYGGKMGAGGTTGVKAYADAMTAAGVPTTVLEGNKVARINPETGKPDMSTVIDMSDSSKWTGDAIKSEFSKNINTLRGEADIYKATEKENKQQAWEKEKFYVGEQNKLDIAKLGKEAQLGVASIYASASNAGRGGSTTKPDYTETIRALGGAVTPSIMGKNISFVYDPNKGYSFIDLKTGEPYYPTEEQAGKFNESMTKGIQSAYIMTGSTGAPSGYTGTNVGAGLGNIHVADTNAATSIGVALDAAAAAKKAADAVFSRPANSSSIGSVMNFYSTWDPDNPVAAYPEVSGKIVDTTIPFGLSYPTPGESTPYPFGLTVVK